MFHHSCSYSYFFISHFELSNVPSANIYWFFFFPQLTKFTQMNVWTHYYYWSKQYPKGPDDIICSKSHQKKRNETIVIDQDLPTATGGEDQF